MSSAVPASAAASSSSVLTSVHLPGGHVRRGSNPCAITALPPPALIHPAARRVRSLSPIRKALPGPLTATETLKQRYPLTSAQPPSQSVHVSSQDVRSAALAAIVPTQADTPPNAAPLSDGPASWEDQVDAADLVKYKPKHVPSPNQPSAEQLASNGNDRPVPASPASLTPTAQPLSSAPVHNGAQLHSLPIAPMTAIASVPAVAVSSLPTSAPPLLALPSAALQTTAVSASTLPAQPAPKVSPRIVAAKPPPPAAPAKVAAKAASTKAKPRIPVIATSSLGGMSFPLFAGMPLYSAVSYSSPMHHHNAMAAQHMSHAWPMPPTHDGPYSSMAHAAAAAGREAALQDTIRELKEQVIRQDMFLCERSEREEDLQHRLAEALEQVTQLEDREMRHFERERDRRAQKHEEMLEDARQEEQRNHLAQLQMRARVDTPATSSSSSPAASGSPFLRSLLSTPVGDSCLNVNLAGDMLASLPPAAVAASGTARTSRFSGAFRRIFSAVDPLDFERSNGAPIERFCSRELTMLHARQANTSWDAVPPASSSANGCVSPISIGRPESVVTPPALTNGSADSSAASSAAPSPRSNNIWSNSPLLDAHQPTLMLPRVFKLHSASLLDAMAPLASRPPDPTLWALMDAHAVSFPHGIRTLAPAAATVIVKPVPVQQITPAPSFASAPPPAASISLPSVSSSSPAAVPTPVPPPPSRVSAWTKPLVLDVPPAPAPMVAAVAVPPVVLKPAIVPYPRSSNIAAMPSPRNNRAQKAKEHSKVSGTKLKKKQKNAAKPAAASARSAPSVAVRSPPRSRPVTPRAGSKATATAAASNTTESSSRNGAAQPLSQLSVATNGEESSPKPQPKLQPLSPPSPAHAQQHHDASIAAISAALSFDHQPNELVRSSDPAALLTMQHVPPAVESSSSAAAAADPEPAPANASAVPPPSPSPPLLLPPPPLPASVDSASAPIVIASSSAAASPSLSPHAPAFTPRPSPAITATATTAAADATVTATSASSISLTSPTAVDRDTPRAVEPASAPPPSLQPLYRSSSGPVPLLLPPPPPLNLFPPPAVPPVPPPAAVASLSPASAPSVHSAPFSVQPWHPHQLAFPQPHLAQYSAHPLHLPPPLLPMPYYVPHLRPQQQQQQPQPHPTPHPGPFAMTPQYGGGAIMHVSPQQQQQHAQQMHAHVQNQMQQQQAAAAAAAASYSAAYGFPPPQPYWPL